MIAYNAYDTNSIQTFFRCLCIKRFRASFCWVGV